MQHSQKQEQRIQKIIEGYNREKEILTNKLCQVGITDARIPLERRLSEIDKELKTLILSQ